MSSNEEKMSSNEEKALLKAIRNKDVGAVKEAVESGANPNSLTTWTEDNNGVTYEDVPIFFKAVWMSSVGVVQALLNAADDIDIELPGYKGVTPLLQAVYNGDTAMIDLLVDKANADINNASGDTNFTPLNSTVLNENQSIALQLINKGADVNLPSGVHGQTPLYSAVLKDNFALVQLLLKRKANPNLATNISARPPLVLAAKKGSITICHRLLAAGAEPDATDGQGFFAMYFAAKDGNRDLIKLLRSNGADPQLKIPGRPLPATKARQEGHEELADWLSKLKIKS